MLMRPVDYWTLFIEVDATLRGLWVATGRVCRGIRLLLQSTLKNEMRESGFDFLVLVQALSAVDDNNSSHRGSGRGGKSGHVRPA